MKFSNNLSAANTRLQQTNGYRVMDLIPEQDFEEILNLTAHLSEVPIVMISLMGESKVWLKAVKVNGLEKISGDIPFQHAISKPLQVVQVEDTLLDSRFSTHSLVTGVPNIRFYAGTTLLSAKGSALGTLSVLDVKPRKLTESQLSALKTLGTQVARQLEFRKQKEELMHAREEAGEAKKAKDQFLSRLSLEIRTSMNNIVGMAKLLLEENLPQSQKALVSGIDYSCWQLLEVMNDILDVSNTEAEELPFKHANFDLLNILNTFQTSTSSKAKEKGLDFLVSLDPRLPRMVAGDPAHLKQILTNTVGNAIKFTKKGGVGLHISLKEVTDKGSKVLFSVNDTGIGIPTDRLKTLSMEFRQPISSSSSAFAETRRGLSVTKKLVEQYDGQIQVESLQGKGSCFTFDLQFAHQIHEKNHGAVNSKQTLKILVADNCPANQLVAHKWLEKLEHQVDLAGNGKEAVEMSCIKVYDVILMDLQMPLLDGIEATRIIRKNPDPVQRNVCIIALTASLMDHHVVAACKKAGMDHFIPKPFEPRKLEQQIIKVLKAKRESTELAFISNCL